MKLVAALIVRNERENLVRCLDAAAKVVEGFVIDDTGSTDDTIEVARAWSEKHGIPVLLHEEPWVNFKVNRTRLLDRARPEGDWIVLLDADMVLHAPDPLPDLEGSDCWEGRVDFGGLDYTLPLIVRASKPWFFEGVAHSYLACSEPVSEAEMPGLWVEDHSHTSPEKLERDLVALLADHAAHPEGARTTFYLAQTYYDLDRIPEAIIFYRKRAEMGNGWDEERYFARYRLGCLLCEHVSFAEGAKELLGAWESRPGRIEALRALAGSATAVANKVPLTGDRLFVGSASYRKHVIAALPDEASEPEPMPPFPPIRPKARPRGRKHPRGPEEITAIIVTRGDVPLEPIIDTLPYEDVLVWDNSATSACETVAANGRTYRRLGGANYRAFGRYAAIPHARHPWIYWQDDDVIFTRHAALIAAYERNRLVCNMDESWIEGAGYRDLCGMQGAGSICDARLPDQVWARYLKHHPWDDDALVECDFVFGTLVPFTVVDLGYEVREFADDADRLYQQPGQTARKHAMIQRCRAILDAEAAVESSVRGRQQQEEGAA